MKATRKEPVNNRNAIGFEQRKAEAARLAAAEPGLSARKIAKRVGMSESSVIRAIAGVRQKHRATVITDDPPDLVRSRVCKLLLRHHKILEMVDDAARHDWPCPSNVQIADELGEDITSSAVASLLVTMERNGLLAIQRDPATYGRRRIWSASVGKWTGWTSPPHSYRAGQEMTPRTCIRCRETFMSRRPPAEHRFCNSCDEARRTTYEVEHSLTI